ncbi:unnamed protein product [Paramecium sonneborni]|uniref:Uncharacterized protein n=1 Tax=Paramecium sonneborni TaxID=65129 RepID=A0A8S1QAN8_9CILI|nr:unnamed protein product [Paramecium sonneborni]
MQPMHSSQDLAGSTNILDKKLVNREDFKLYSQGHAQYEIENQNKIYEFQIELKNAFRINCHVYFVIEQKENTLVYIKVKKRNEKHIFYSSRRCKINRFLISQYEKRKQREIIYQIIRISDNLASEIVNKSGNFHENRTFEILIYEMKNGFTQLRDSNNDFKKISSKIIEYSSIYPKKISLQKQSMGTQGVKYDD